MCIDRLVIPARRTRLRQSGVSLIELIVFIVIIGVALGGVLTVLNTTVMHSADPMIRKQMMAIGEALLEEVELQPFTFCVPGDENAHTASGVGGCSAVAGFGVQGFGQPSGAGGSRALFNNVGNYCNEVGTGGSTCTALALGTASSSSSKIPDMTGLSFSPDGYWATIELVAAGEALTGSNGGSVSSATNAPADQNLIRVRVTVSSTHTSEQIVLEGYRTRWSPNT